MVCFGPVTPSELSIAIGALTLGAAVFAWGFYFRWKDALHPEPVWLMLVGVGGGAGSVLVAQGGYQLADSIGVRTSWELLSEGAANEVLAVAVMIGVIEELAKLVPVLTIVLFARSHFDEPLDGLVYAGCSAIGFSVAETALIAWYQDLPAMEFFARAAAAPISHAMLSAPWGVGLAVTYFQKKPVPLALGFALSVIAHGLYDVFITIQDIGPLLGALLILALWVWAIRVTPRLVGLAREKREPATPGQSLR